MKKSTLALTLAGALLSVNATASSLDYNVSLLTTTIEDSTAFGGTATGTVFSGLFSVDPQELGEMVVSFDDKTIADPTQLAYQFTIGDHDFSYAYDADRDYIDSPDFGLGLTTFEVIGNDSSSNFEVTGIESFIFEQSGDADSYELSIDSELGTWSAYDNSTGYSINGTASISAVPVPAAVWMFGSALLGLTRFKIRRSFTI